MDESRVDVSIMNWFVAIHPVREITYSRVPLLSERYLAS